MATDPTLHLAVSLRKIRKLRGISQRMLAEMSGVSRPTIANIERRVYSTTQLATVYALAAALRVPVSDLLPQGR
jgi:XRE family transcriptional regulator, regulator of sulfur utilization